MTLDLIKFTIDAELKGYPRLGNTESFNNASVNLLWEERSIYLQRHSGKAGLSTG